jgi:hypothetical protein
MQENILKKVKPGAHLLPKKFLPISDKEWALIERYK